MNPNYIVLPALVFLLALFYLLLRHLGRMWLQHGIRLALLEKIEKRPDLLDPMHELLEILTGDPAKSYRATQDFRITGLFLALIGVGCMMAGRFLRIGQIPKGIFIGGFLCVCLGILLFFVGLLVRWLAREPKIKHKKQKAE